MIDVVLVDVVERYSSLYNCTQVITKGYLGPYESKIIII